MTHDELLNELQTAQAECDRLVAHYLQIAAEIEQQVCLAREHKKNLSKIYETIREMQANERGEFGLDPDWWRQGCAEDADDK